MMDRYLHMTIPYSKEEAKSHAFLVTISNNGKSSFKELTD